MQAKNKKTSLLTVVNLGEGGGGGSRRKKKS